MRRIKALRLRLLMPGPSCWAGGRWAGGFPCLPAPATPIPIHSVHRRRPQMRNELSSTACPAPPAPLPPCPAFADDEGAAAGVPQGDARAQAGGEPGQLQGWAAGVVGRCAAAPPTLPGRGGQRRGSLRSRRASPAGSACAALRSCARMPRAAASAAHPRSPPSPSLPPRAQHLIFFRDGVSEGQFKEVYYVRGRGGGVKGAWGQRPISHVRPRAGHRPLHPCPCQALLFHLPSTGATPPRAPAAPPQSEYSAVREACRELGDPAADCEAGRGAAAAAAAV